MNSGERDSASLVYINPMFLTTKGYLKTERSNLRLTDRDIILVSRVAELLELCTDFLAPDHSLAPKKKRKLPCLQIEIPLKLTNLKVTRSTPTKMRHSLKSPTVLKPVEPDLRVIEESEDCLEATHSSPVTQARKKNQRLSCLPVVQTQRVPQSMEDLTKMAKTGEQSGSK